MRAFAVLHFGDTPAVRDLPIPGVDGGYLIRVHAAGVNPVDYKLVEGLTATSRYPYVVGLDFAGVVEQVPDGARDLRVGDRVFGIARTHGSYTEYTAVALDAPIEPVARIPDGIAYEQAAALPVPALTALGSLALLGVTGGQRLVVMGATGAVGGHATQMARARGAHVIATVRGNVDEARRLGAAEVYDSGSVDAMEAIQATHPGGVDAVLDIVSGPEAVRRDAGILREGGGLVSTLYAADVAWFAERQITAYNISSSATSDSPRAHRNPSMSPAGLTEVGRMLGNGTITARIGCTVELDGAGQVIDQLRAGSLRGKAIIRL
jgi:NADPH:quinone reductase-like Zn-dependent oxidoreductase